MVFYIYKIVGINYIGSTNNIKRRCRKHKSSCWNENGIDYNYLVYQYIREKNIKIELEILFCYKDNCSNRIQRLVEQFYINKYDSVNNGLNSQSAFGFDEKKYQKKYREERKEYHKKYSKKYREENKEKIKKYKKKWRQENKEKILEQQKKYREKYREKYKVKINCCLCDSLVRKSDIKRHQRSKKCKSFQSNFK